MLVSTCASISQVLSQTLLYWQQPGLNQSAPQSSHPTTIRQSHTNLSLSI